MTKNIREQLTAYKNNIVTYIQVAGELQGNKELHKSR
jgi:hypothetical protein